VWEIQSCAAGNSRSNTSLLESHSAVLLDGLQNCPTCQLSLPFAESRVRLCPRCTPDPRPPTSSESPLPPIGSCACIRRSALSGGLRLCKAFQETSLLGPRAVSTCADANLVVLCIPFPDAHRARLVSTSLPSRTSPPRRTSTPVRSRTRTCCVGRCTTLRAIDRFRARRSVSSVMPAQMTCSASRGSGGEDVVKATGAGIHMASISQVRPPIAVHASRRWPCTRRAGLQPDRPPAVPRSAGANCHWAGRDCQRGRRRAHVCRGAV
jgi:hypothetical protein